jgi:hypothetical protein
MRIVTFIKILAAIAVLAVMAGTGYILREAQKVGVILPDPSRDKIDELPEASNLPDVDPGERFFQRALEMVAMGKRDQAKEKLLYILNFHPSSPSAGEARRILGEMNLDEILSTESMEGKSKHKVVRGDSFLGIAGKNNTTLEAIIYFNGLTSLDALFPGDELVVMPLNFHLVVEPGRRMLSLWRGDKMLKEYPMVRSEPTAAALTTKIEGKSGLAGGRKVAATDPAFRNAQKSLTLAKTQLQIRGHNPADGPESGRGFFVSSADMEELSLLLRPGNEVEIRSSAR